MGKFYKSAAPKFIKLIKKDLLSSDAIARITEGMTSERVIKFLGSGQEGIAEKILSPLAKVPIVKKTYNFKAPFATRRILDEKEKIYKQVADIPAFPKYYGRRGDSTYHEFVPTSPYNFGQALEVAKTLDRLPERGINIVDVAPLSMHNVVGGKIIDFLPGKHSMLKHTPFGDKRDQKAILLRELRRHKGIFKRLKDRGSKNRYSSRVKLVKDFYSGREKLTLSQHKKEIYGKVL
jgi:hypothetical protein